MPRIVCNFSCGVASAVATKLVLTANYLPFGATDIDIIYCEVVEEHGDNMRFLKDCEKWFGKEIKIVGNDLRKRSIYEVFEKTKFLIGPRGARCTGELKKSVRLDHQQHDDVVVLGYTSEEQNRIDRIRASEPNTKFWPILIDKGLRKEDCKAIIERANIEMPTMYKLGYHNNNCIGCVKGGAGYWNKIKIDFPKEFARMAAMERKLNRQICKREWVENGVKHLKRVFLDELPADLGNYPSEAETQCGIFCYLAEQDIENSEHKDGK